MKEKHNMDLATPLCTSYRGISIHKNRKGMSFQNHFQWKSILYSHNKKCFQKKQLFSNHSLREKCYFHKLPVEIENDIEMDSEFNEIMRDPSSQEDGKIVKSVNLEKDALNSLEWKSVCNQVSEFASTSMGYMLAKEGSLPIGTDLHKSKELLDQTAAALLLPGALDFSAIQDVRNIIDSAVSGNMCRIRELCSVKNTLHSGRSIFDHLCNLVSERTLDGKFLDFDAQKKGALEPLLKIFEGADFCTDLENQLGYCLECKFLSVLDRASPALATIRSSRRSNIEALEALMKETAARIAEARGIDSPVVTKRRSRLCVGIRATHKSLLLGGIILDVSSSGATYFMEPNDALDLNNMEVQLAAAERTEELAILRGLSSRIAGEFVNINNMLERIMAIDLACARAAHACWLGAVRPMFTQEGTIGSTHVELDTRIEISEPQSSFVDIESIRHPLLLQPALKKPSSLLSSMGFRSSIQKQDTSSIDVETVENSNENIGKLPVPIDIKIGPGKKVVVISGPNTGGKTATLKTLGIAALMAKAGMFLPAKGQPKLPWFDHVMADIGDNQSLEQSLSTYSAHIQRLCKILEVGTSQSLVLIDEIGSGTDPSEGVALSASILQHLASQVNLTVVTTHYSDLSKLKDKDDRFENAAAEFDVETLQPTYRILWGTMGQSNALDIAQSIGFDPKILFCAREWVIKLFPDMKKERQSGLFQSLSKQRDDLQDQARAVASILCESKQLHDEILDEAEDLDKREAALKAMVEEAVEKELIEVKDRMDEVIANFEKQMHGENTDFSALNMKEAQAAIAFIVEEYCPNATEALHVQANSPNFSVPEIGDQVLIKRLGSKLATVAEIPSKEDGHLLVQLGKIKLRVKMNEIEKIVSNRRAGSTGLISSRERKGKVLTNERKTKGSEPLEVEELKFEPVIQTSRNTLDLRGMQVEDAIRETNIAIASKRHVSTLFVIHGIGTGAVREAVLNMLKRHPRVVKFEQESPMNFGCTIVYIR